MHKTDPEVMQGGWRKWIKGKKQVSGLELTFKETEAQPEISRVSSQF